MNTNPIFRYLSPTETSYTHCYTQSTIYCGVRIFDVHRAETSINPLDAGSYLSDSVCLVLTVIKVIKVLSAQCKQELLEVKAAWLSVQQIFQNVNK